MALYSQLDEDSVFIPSGYQLRRVRINVVEVDGIVGWQLMWTGDGVRDIESAKRGKWDQARPIVYDLSIPKDDFLLEIQYSYEGIKLVGIRMKLLLEGWTKWCGCKRVSLAVTVVHLSAKMTLNNEMTPPEGTIIIMSSESSNVIKFYHVGGNVLVNRILRTSKVLKEKTDNKQLDIRTYLQINEMHNKSIDEILRIAETNTASLDDVEEYVTAGKDEKLHPAMPRNYIIGLTGIELSIEGNKRGITGMGLVVRRVLDQNVFSYHWVQDAIVTHKPNKPFVSPLMKMENFHKQQSVSNGFQQLKSLDSQPPSEQQAASRPYSELSSQQLSQQNSSRQDQLHTGNSQQISAQLGSNANSRKQSRDSQLGRDLIPPVSRGSIRSNAGGPGSGDKIITESSNLPDRLSIGRTISGISFGRSHSFATSDASFDLMPNSLARLGSGGSVRPGSGSVASSTSGAVARLPIIERFMKLLPSAIDHQKFMEESALAYDGLNRGEFFDGSDEGSRNSTAATPRNRYAYTSFDENDFSDLLDEDERDDYNVFEKAKKKVNKESDEVLLDEHRTQITTDEFGNLLFKVHHQLTLAERQFFDVVRMRTAEVKMAQVRVEKFSRRVWTSLEVRFDKDLRKLSSIKILPGWII